MLCMKTVTFQIKKDDYEIIKEAARLNDRSLSKEISRVARIFYAGSKDELEAEWFANSLNRERCS